VAAEIAAGGGRAGVVSADLADPAAVESIVPEAIEAVGDLTLLVNSASLFEADQFGALAVANFDRHFAINLRAPLFLAQAFAARLPAKTLDASIVNIVDQRVLNPRPDFVSYYLSKAALATATATLAQALAPRIRVNAIGPGPTFRNTLQSEADFVREGAMTPLGHGSTPQDIADGVVYLAGARSVTGQMIAIDGGQHLARPAE
jgi:NAD(P)-dependent dehydrogenase (short-subunit alcohol dehydrogenase family)